MLVERTQNSQGNLDTDIQENFSASDIINRRPVESAKVFDLEVEFPGIAVLPHSIVSYHHTSTLVFLILLTECRILRLAHQFLQLALLSDLDFRNPCIALRTLVDQAWFVIQCGIGLYDLACHW